MVTLTDGDDRALALARRSHALSLHLLPAAVRFVTLPWSADARLSSLFEGAAVTGREAEPDVSADRPDTSSMAASPPLLLGADLFYYSGGVSALLETLHALLPPAGGLAALSANPRYAEWSADVSAGCARHGLTAHCLPVESVLPAAELATGWFANTRLVRHYCVFILVVAI